MFLTTSLSIMCTAKDSSKRKLHFVPECSAGILQFYVFRTYWGINKYLRGRIG